MVQARKLKVGRELGNRRYRKWGDWDVDDYLIGKIERFYEDAYQKLCWEVDVIECSFEDTDAEFKVGEAVGINSCTVLANKLENAELGEIYKFQYVGTDKVAKGAFKGKDFHKVDVWPVEDLSEPIPDPKKTVVSAASKL